MVLVHSERRGPNTTGALHLMAYVYRRGRASALPQGRKGGGDQGTDLRGQNRKKGKNHRTHARCVGRTQTNPQGLVVGLLNNHKRPKHMAIRGGLIN